MPALANLSILDGLAVATTFSIESSGLNNQGLFTWRNRTSLVPVRYDMVSYSSKRGRGSSLLVHHYKLVVPITDTPAGGLEKQVSQCMADIRCYVPDNAPLARRKDFREFLKSLAAQASVTSVLQDGESYY